VYEKFQSQQSVYSLLAALALYFPLSNALPSSESHQAKMPTSTPIVPPESPKPAPENGESTGNSGADVFAG